MDSMINLNSDLARKVCVKENEVDEAYGKIVQEILRKIVSEPKHVQCYIHQLAVADMMEQMGDELKKIAEDVIYTIDAEVVRHQN